MLCGRICMFCVRLSYLTPKRGCFRLGCKYVFVYDRRFNGRSIIDAAQLVVCLGNRTDGIKVAVQQSLLSCSVAVNCREGRSIHVT